MVVASACLTSPHADRVSMVCWKFVGPQALVVGASGDLERHHSARQTVSLRVPRLLVGDVEAMDRGPTTSARSSDLLITLVASAVVLLSLWTLVVGGRNHIPTRPRHRRLN